MREIGHTNANQVMKQDKYYFLGVFRFWRHCRNADLTILQQSCAAPKVEGLSGTSFREQQEPEIYLAEGTIRTQRGQVGGKGLTPPGYWGMFWCWDWDRDPSPVKFQFSLSSKPLLHQ